MDNAAFELPPAYEALRAEARSVANSVTHLADVAGQKPGFVPEIREAIARSGLATLVVPSAYGGRAEQVDPLAVTVVREELAAVSGHLDSLFVMQGIGSFALTMAGNDDLRQEWLPRVGRHEAIPALGLTEPHIGSDLKALTTTIEQRGDALIIRGVKSFITNAGEADFYCVLGREGDGYSLVLVPTATDGVSVAHPHQVMDNHVLGDVTFSDVVVPASHRLGEPGAGFDHVLATLGTFRVSVAGAAIGLAEAALSEAMRHASQREMFGTTLSRLGGVPAAIALSWTEIEMARALTYRAASAAGRDPRANLHLSSMAKVGATEISGRVVDRSVQMMGRFGLVQGSVIERLFRESRPMRIYEGSTEVILDSLARQLLKRGLR